MNDLISRQDAIALLIAEKVNTDETQDEADEAYNMAIYDCIEALTNMPSADTMATNEINPLSENVRVSVGSTQRWGWPFT